MLWLAPRVSFSLEDAGGCGGGRDAAGGGGASADLEFLLAGCSAVSTMLPADELFSGGKLVPLRLPSSSKAAAAATRPPLAPAPTTQQPEMARSEETPRAEAAKDAVVEAEQAAEEPKAPARRWRDLLRMRKQQASASSSSSSSSSTETKPLRRLLHRGPKPPEQEPSLSLPLLRDPNDADMPPASAPTPSPTPPPPVSTSQHQLPPKIRLTAAQAAAAGTVSP
ncbi:formin-like protein 5 [Hordeum vulgare]|nr:formin-like protein 5 [Hordeum vulgare]